MEEKQHLVGTIDKVIYRSEENGFVVCMLKVRANEKITVTGYLPAVHQGETVTFSGTWGFHPKFGRQFKAEECQAKLPTNVIGIQKYLSSGLIKGIGPKFAEKMVKRFGEKTLEIIDEDPEQLYKIDGVGPKRVEAIIKAWVDQKAISQVMVFLQSKGVSTAFAAKIYKCYGQESVSKIQQNPYRLVDDIWGVGFKMSDQLALKLGFEPHSLYRVAAGIVFAITQEINNGHLYVEVQQVKKTAQELLEIDAVENVEHLLKQALHQLYEQDRIKLLTVDEKHYLSLPQYYYSEKGIADKILKLQAQKTSTFSFDMDAIYKQVRQKDERGLSLNEEQQAGIMTCLQTRVTVITGGPGTGKTTLVKKLLEVLEKSRVKIRCAAPTGRAAKRMFEGTGKNTETLHRLLEFTPQMMNFARNEQNALDVDFLIVDEASMIDVFLMYAVLKALPQHAHLILLGDIDQLPSVGAGNVLSDLISSGQISVVRLQHIFRQAQDSLIVVNAHRINNGEFPTSFQEGSLRDFAFVKQNEPEQVFALLELMYTKKLKKLGISPDDSVVLVPMNRGIVGTQRINQELQRILNPEHASKKQIMRFGLAYREGDRVMQIRNNYDKFVFNGDMGKLTEIKGESSKFMVKFGNRELEYDFAEIDELVLAYAISIHKSQGSEFKAVIVPIFMSHFILLQRNLIYTAITRAKNLCVLAGQPKAIAMGIKNNKGTVRTTFLDKFLTTDLQAR